MRPGSVALLPVSSASTGLLCLSVGARVHCGRSDTEVSVWPLPRAYHIRCVTYIISSPININWSKQSYLPFPFMPPFEVKCDSCLSYKSK